MAGRFSVDAVFRAVDKITAPVTRMQNRVSKMTRSMERGFRRLNKMVSKFGGLAKKGALAATVALAGTGAAMLKVITTGAKFEQTLVSAAAKFPGEVRKGTEAFEKLAEAAKKTGATTEFSASQSAEALNFLAMAGLGVEASIAALPGVVDLATSAGIELGEATDVATDSLGAFGLATKDAAQLGKNLARINDVIAKTTTTANTDVAAMFETITKGAAVATAAGASLETFAALTGELANAGIKGSVAGTTLKNVFASLAKPSTEAQKVFKRLGIATQDSEGNMRDVIDVLGDVDKALGDSGTAGRLKAITTLFGKIPLAGVNVLFKAGTKQLKAYRKTLEGAEGSSKKMADTMRDTVTGRFKSFMSAVEGVQIAIFDLSSGPLADVLDKMTAWVRVNQDVIASNLGKWMAGIIDRFSNIDKWLDKVIANFGIIVTWAKRIGIVLGVFIAFTAILKTLVLIMTAVNLVMALNPIGLMVLGVTALIAGLTLLFTWLEEITASFDSMPGFMRLLLAPLRLIMAAMQGIKDLAGGVVKFFGFGDKAKESLGNLEEVQKVTATPPIVKKQEKGFTAESLRDLEDVQKVTAIPPVVKKQEKGFFASVFGGDEEEEEKNGKDGENGKNGQPATVVPLPQIVTPQEQVIRSIEEQRTLSTSEITIRDETGRAEVSGGKLGAGVTLQPTGGF